MPTGKTFFSYSRADSTFVLKLANDLRNAGVAIWLDQLDIKAGDHWDTAIESALNAAPNLILVLSNDSVKSENVMDEVSFALESGKSVIPVLLNECTVPFRLKRLQRIDFTGDYQTGLHQLLQVLNQPIIAGNITPINSDEEENETLQELQKRQAVSPDKPSTSTPRKSLSYLLLASISLLVIIGIGYYYFHNKSHSSTAESGSNNQFITVRVFDEDKNPVTKGNVTLSFPHYQRSSAMNEKGMVVFPDIPYDQLRSKIIINVECDGYTSRTIDTLLSNFDPIDLTVSQAKVMRLSGIVKDAADRPIKDVEVAVDGTPYGTKTINDGSFEIPIPGYHFGDRVILVTSHPDYEDKSKQFNIESGKIDNIEFVLNPISPINIKHKGK